MNEPEYRVGPKQPGNLYRNNQRFGFVLRDEDGPMVAAALNAWTAKLCGEDDVLREQRDAARSQVAELTRERDQWRASYETLKGDFRRIREQRGYYRVMLLDRVKRLGECIGSSDCPAPVHEDDCWASPEAGRAAAQEGGEPPAHHTCHDACPCEGNPSYRAHMEHRRPTADCPWCPDLAELLEGGGTDG